MRLLVTGASGFVGLGVLEAAKARDFEPVAAVRDSRGTVPRGAVVVGEIGPNTRWREALEGVGAVIHLAARVHVMRETTADPLTQFRRVNVAGSAALAQQAAAVGVRRLVFVSSAKVNGERTAGRAFTEEDPAAPEDPYSRSKFEAELALLEVSRSTGLEVAIVRPTLVVGPGAGGNLQRLLGLIATGVPLPFGAVANRRSLVSRAGLAELLLLAATHPRAAGETFLAAELPPLSTPRLVELLAEGLGRPARLWRLPAVLLHAFRHLPGAGLTLERLLGSLEVDASKARGSLGWAPAVSLEDRVREMAADFRRARGGATG